MSSNSVLFTVTESEIPVHSGPGAKNYPNPFDPVIGEETIFTFDMKGASMDVGVYVYDLAGRLVWKEERIVSVGQITWDGRDSREKILGNGPYLAILIDRDKESIIGRCKPFVLKSSN